MRIAIIGTGISGLGAAWALHRDHDITVFEAQDRIGGHSNTVDVPTARGPIPVDTGFIVYNEATYPHLTRLFDVLGVPTEPSDMSFSYTVDGGVEYAAGVRGLLAHPGNLLDRRYRSMIRDILRFRRLGRDLLDEAGDRAIGDLLSSHAFSEGFIDDYLLPMTGAIWSARRSEIRRFPAATMLRFLANHGLIEIVGRPPWRTVTGGSREYVARLTAPFRDRILTASPVTAVKRATGSVAVSSGDDTYEFDHIVIASHSDQALAMLGDGATEAERSSLGAIRYERNLALLHSDPALMPRSRAAWSSWNTAAATTGQASRRVSVTYWMNRLQNLETSEPMFVSLNPLHDPDPDLVHAAFRYAHPQFDAPAVSAQQRIATLQGTNRTWFAGAYLGYGFHEDGLQSGLHVAAALGSPVSWYDEVVEQSSAPRPAAVVSP